MGEPQFVDGKVVGELDLGVFTQVIFTRHIYRRYNAKGIDKRLLKVLRGEGCYKWRLVFGDTKQVVSIPLARIELSGSPHNVGGGVAEQILVPLEYFDEEKPATQRRML